MNWNAKNTLLPVNGLAFRTFALAASDFHATYSACVQTLKFSTFADDIKAKNLPPEIAKDLPYKVDGEQLWAVIRRYISAYIGVFYRSDEEVINDLAIRQFYAHYESPAAWIDYGMPPLSLNSLVDLLTHSVFWITGGHEFLGGLMQYVLHPAGLMGRIPRDKSEGDTDSFYMIAALFGTTGKTDQIKSDLCTTVAAL